MTKFPETGKKFNRNWMFEVEPYSRVEPKTFEGVDDGQRLKWFLKRAVERDFAPESLIDSIKKGIRQ